MTAAETEGMRAIETAIHHLVRRLLKAIDHHEGYRLYAAEFNRLKSCARVATRSRHRNRCTVRREV